MTMPKLLVTPFADEGLKNSIPVSAEPDALANTASYKKGFPQATMTPVELGGMPPSGKDMNGILHELSAHMARHQDGLFLPEKNLTNFSKPNYLNDLIKLPAWKNCANLKAAMLQKLSRSPVIMQTARSAAASLLPTHATNPPPTTAAP